MTLDDPAAVADLGSVDIDVIYDDVEDMRAYEDYLSSDDNGFNNYEKYDSYDPRVFEYLRLQGISSESSIEVP